MALFSQEVLLSSMKEDMTSAETSHTVLDLFRVPILRLRTICLSIVRYPIMAPVGEGEGVARRVRISGWGRRLPQEAGRGRMRRRGLEAGSAGSQLEGKAGSGRGPRATHPAVAGEDHCVAAWDTPQQPHSRRAKCMRPPTYPSEQTHTVSSFTPLRTNGARQGK